MVVVVIGWVSAKLDAFLLLESQLLCEFLFEGLCVRI